GTVKFAIARKSRSRFVASDKGSLAFGSTRARGEGRQINMLPASGARIVLRRVQIRLNSLRIKFVDSALPSVRDQSEAHMMIPRLGLTFLIGLAILSGAARAEPPEEKARPRTDLYGDPLPDSALARLGTVRWRHGSGATFVAFP